MAPTGIGELEGTNDFAFTIHPHEIVTVRIAESHN